MTFCKIKRKKKTTQAPQTPDCTFLLILRLFVLLVHFFSLSVKQLHVFTLFCLHKDRLFFFHKDRHYLGFVSQWLPPFTFVLASLDSPKSTIQLSGITECPSNKTYFDCNASPDWTSRTPVQLRCGTSQTDLVCIQLFSMPHFFFILYFINDTVQHSISEKAIVTNNSHFSFFLSSFFFTNGFNLLPVSLQFHLFTFLFVFIVFMWEFSRDVPPTEIWFKFTNKK